jgi:hypothetical protein
MDRLPVAAAARAAFDLLARDGVQAALVPETGAV